MNFDFFAFFGVAKEWYVWHGGDDVHIKLTVEALLYDFHVEQAKKTAAEAETKCRRRLGLKRKRCIVQLQFLERCTQVFVLIGNNRINACKNHRFHIFKTFDCLVARAIDVCYGVANLHLARGFYA